MVESTDPKPKQGIDPELEKALKAAGIKPEDVLSLRVKTKDKETLEILPDGTVTSFDDPSSPDIPKTEE